MDTFRIHLNAGERLALDVDPVSLHSAVFGLASSTLEILGSDGESILATIGRSAEPSTGVKTDNPAHLFQAPQSGDYYLRLQTGIAANRGYRLEFHRLGISEDVPSPELLAQAGAMFAWFDGNDTVGITGPTGYGFTLEGNWQQKTSTVSRTGLTEQTLTMPAGNSFTLSNGRGLSIPFVAETDVVITTKRQRWGDFVGEVKTASITFDTSTGMNPLYDKLLFTFGPGFEFQTLNDPWELTMGSRIQKQRGIEAALPGIPYFIQHRPFHIDEFHAALGDLSFKQAVDIINKRTLLVDFADPMVYVAQEGAIGPFQKPVIAFSLNGNLPFESVEMPSADAPVSLTKFYGHVYASLAGKIKIFSDFWKVPLSIPVGVEGNIAVNLDADGDGQWLGGLGNVAQFFAGNLAAQVAILQDVQLGVNTSINTDFNALSQKLDVEMNLGKATLVINGPEETLWIKGRVGPGENPFGNSVLNDLTMKNNSAVEMFFERGGDYYISADAQISLAGAELSAALRISNEGIHAALEGSAIWSARIDYGAGTVSGKAKATIAAAIAIEIDDDNDVYLSGSISAHGRLTANIGGHSTVLFSGGIDASVRSSGLRFKFPRGVGNLNLDLF